MEEYKNVNGMEMKLELKRIDVCDLLLACSFVGNGKDNKWTKLHDKIKEQLKEFDKENEVE